MGKACVMGPGGQGGSDPRGRPSGAAFSARRERPCFMTENHFFALSDMRKRRTASHMLRPACSITVCSLPGTHAHTHTHTYTHTRANRLYPEAPAALQWALLPPLLSLYGQPPPSPEQQQEVAAAYVDLQDLSSGTAVGLVWRNAFPNSRCAVVTWDAVGAEPA